ncbi:D-methionine transport system substrate-binding protein [Bacillus oleivorans]|uniref:Lipoprotein n=1 Tax=Bacillus oleivorans TaxID=1448271 RepID=A0A285CZ37_9BACI|nr:MetQ/NlpA family ABC transporter substrate-binding protein [Bacillus oleivorans]SNX72316.1 D-methionine transport system substrate-binding protein [Bacillus oleivorans]
MKKWFSLIFIFSFALVLAACGTANNENEGAEGNGDANNDAAEEETTTLVVGASNVPHAVILEKAKPLLEAKGIELQIEEYTDYIFPNQDLDNETLDANYFQHIPYLEAQIAEHGYDFVNAGGIHIEPIGVYSKKYDSLEDLPDGAVIIMSNSIPDHGRILTMLENEGLIKLDENVEKTAAEVKDIVENPKNLQFEYDYEAALLPQLYEEGEGDAILINSNYAIDNGLNPVEDAIALENSESPYVNVIAVRSGDEDSEAIQTLIEVLRSEEIQNFILEEYGGAVVPVSGE